MFFINRFEHQITLINLSDTTETHSCYIGTFHNFKMKRTPWICSYNSFIHYLETI